MPYNMAGEIAFWLPLLPSEATHSIANITIGWWEGCRRSNKDFVKMGSLSHCLARLIKFTLIILNTSVSTL
jgi:hypothetical protein